MEVEELALLFSALLSVVRFSVSFTPEDNYLIDCGSNTDVLVDNRLFIGDSVERGFVFSGESFASTAQNPRAGVPFLYRTARVFRTTSSYTFPVRKNGTHIVRLHLFPFRDSKINLAASANFSVSINGIGVLAVSGVSPTLREYVLSVPGTTVTVGFSPLGDSSVAFVSAMEVFSAPDDLIVPDPGAKSVGTTAGVVRSDYGEMVLEIVHRINVGGLRLTPSNDTLWRFWEPDENFLVLKSAAKPAFTTEKLNYRSGGATREVAPEAVYMTAQQMNRDSFIADSIFNISWDFPVDGDDGDHRHFIRLHFCDIVSISVHQLFFSVFINGGSAYADLDLSVLTNNRLASPYYLDFVSVSNRGLIRISVGPSELSTPLRKNAILNGIEIWKMVDTGENKNNDNKNKNKNKKKNISVMVFSVTLPALSCIALLSSVLAALKCRKKKNGEEPEAPSHKNGLCSGLRLSYSDIRRATEDFDKSRIIGLGGFGLVYRGVLEDGREVAVKRGVPGSKQGLPEFRTEISFLSKIHHHHLVSLIGYCEEQSEMILVYEHVERGTLKEHLYGGCEQKMLSWKQRLEVCIGAATGLHYLHTGSSDGIIHRDVKSSNILIDRNYSAKVSDFGLSRSGPRAGETHVSTGVKGSFGYLDPEYFRTQRLTEKSDVYSFGVVLLEILCGRSAVDPVLAREQVNLAEWAIERVRNGLVGRIVDPLVAGEIRVPSMNRFAEITEKCLLDHGADRPSMGEVLWNLEQALRLQLRPSEEDLSVPFDKAQITDSM